MISKTGNYKVGGAKMQGPIVVAEGVRIGTVIGATGAGLTAGETENSAEVIRVELNKGVVLSVKDGEHAKSTTISKAAKKRKVRAPKQYALRPNRLRGVVEGLRLQRDVKNALRVEAAKTQAEASQVSARIDRFLTLDARTKPSAFQPDARARAILRGVAVAEQLLRESGGTFDLEQVRTLLGGVSRQAVDKRVRARTLLTVPGPNGIRLYPTIQFGGRNNGPVDGIKEIHEAMPNAGPWSILAFLHNEQDELGGARPIELLRTGRMKDKERVFMAARQQNVHAA